MASTGPFARLRLLGGATLESDQGPISGRGAQRRRIAMLAILAGMRRPVSRDKIIGLLWEESDSERARKLLSESLYVLRKALGEESLVTTGRDVTLNPDVVWCDVAEFHAALDRKDDAAAVAAYSGTFLDGFFISDAPEFEKWLDGTRDSLARAHCDALSRLAASAESEGRFDDATRWWRRLAEQDPFNAAYALGLMRALERTGQRAAALQHARVHAALLRNEFDADPDPAIAAFAMQLKDQPPGAPVTPVKTALTPDVALKQRAAPTEVEVIAGAIAPTPPQPGPSPSRSPSRRPTLTIALTAIAIVGIVAFVVFGNRKTPANVAKAVVIAVFPFDARGDSLGLRAGMPELLSAKLDGAGNVRTVDSHALLSYLGKQTSMLAPPEAAAIAKRFGADFFILGDVTQAGGQTDMNATLYGIAGDSVIQRASVRGQTDSLHTLVDQLAAQLAASQGIAPGELTELARQTTPRFEALKAYLEGEVHYRDARYNEAVSSFTRAIAVDPKFALAHYRLSAAAEWSFEFELARTAARSALEHSEQLPPRYAPLVRAWHSFVNGKAADAQREYEAVLANYPADVEARSALGEVLVHFNPPRGRPEDEARAAFERVREVAPAYGEVRFHTMEFAVRDRTKERFDSLFATVDPANRQYLAWRAVRAHTWGTTAEQTAAVSALSKANNEQTIGIAAGRLAAHAHNFAGARAIARELTKPNRTEQWRAGGHLMTAELYLAGGKLADAQREIEQASRIEQDWTMELATLFLLHPLVTATPEQLRLQQTKLLAWDPHSHVPSTTFFFKVHALQHARLRFYLLGLVSARLGEYEKADEYARAIGRESGEAESVAFGSALATSLNGHIARAKGDRKRALELLTTATIDAPPEFVALSPFYSRAYDRFVIAEMYAEQGATAEANRWFSSLLEAYDFMYAAAAHEKLAQLAERAGDTAGAQRHSARFAELRR